MRSLSQQACSASLHVTDWDQFESHIEEEEKILEKGKKNKGRVILKTENDLRNRQTNNVQARRVIWKKKQNPHKSKSRNKMQAESYWRRNKSLQNQI